MKNLLFLILLSFQVLGQSSVKISGEVQDPDTKEKLAFASLKFTNAESKIIGAQTDQDGKFNIELIKNTYNIEINYVGYAPFKIANLNLKSDTILGKIGLKKSDTNLQELTVTAEKSSTELSLDKRVFNVGKDLASAGGSALDILVNVPAVSVDPDGALKLRGNSNVRILIDGKPSGMVSFKGGAGLRQLQASMIDRVEVITNPSARYEAEGQAGIINIILKKDNKQGLNGSFELITGVPTNYGAAANVNYRKKKLNFFLNYSLAYKGNPYQGTQYQIAGIGPNAFITEQDNSGTVFGLDNNIRGGIEYYFSEKNVLTGSYLYSKAGGNRYTKNIYTDFNKGSNKIENKIGTIERIQDEVEREPLSEYVINYKRSFNDKGHEISAQFRFLDHFENSDQVFTQKGTLANGAIDTKNTFVQTSINDEFEKQYLWQLDYVKPFKKGIKLETGLRTSIRDMVNDFVVNDVNENGKEVPIPEFDNYFIYNENISAAYGILSKKAKKISFQLGLRAEQTAVTTELQKTQEVNPRKYLNFFPTAHFNYTINTVHGAQVSYSKRIKRPGYNDLSPFMTLSDNRNFFSGNPNLNPDYSHVFEIGHIASSNNLSLTSSVYYRYTQDFIFNIRRVNTEGFSTSLPENLISEKAFGVDITSNYAIKKWWKTDVNINVFRAAYDGTNIDPSYKNTTVTWFGRHTSRISFPKGWESQVRLNYDAAQKTAQGSRKAIFFTDLSLRKTLWHKKGSLNFSVLDVFNSRWARFISEGPGFYTSSDRQFRPRQINLTLSYRLKN